MSMPLRITILGIMAFLFLAMQAVAAPYFIGARALSMGGAYTSLSDDPNSIQYNPAGMSQKPYYSVFTNYQRIELLEESSDKKIRIDQYHFAVTDAKTSKYMAAGLSFTANGSPVDVFKNNRDYRTTLALAFPGGDFLHVGVSGTYIRFDEDAPQEHGGTMDAGLLFVPSTWIHVGLAGRNLIPQKHKELAPGELALGLSSSLWGYVTVAFDTTWTWDTNTEKEWNFHLGIEGVIASKVALRGGYFFDEVHDKGYYSAGAAFQSDVGGIGYTFQGNPEELKEFRHALYINLQF